jgi:D-3-phosphoglycerate dehydrogenase
MKKNVLLLETIAEEALRYLEIHTNVFTVYSDSPESLAEQEIHAVVTRGKGQINKTLMDTHPAMQVAARCGVGLDNVDVAEATKRKIKVVNAPGSNAATIAEHTLALMLMAMRNMYTSTHEVKNNNWNWRNQYSGDELEGKTLGIIGMGNIGQRVAKLGEAFGMDVLYWNRSEKDVSASYTPLKELLQKSDVVSLHLPFTDETGCIMGKENISLMKTGSILVNTARAALVDHDALIKALDDNKISGFAADVLPAEPPLPDTLIVNHPRAIITPHSGSLTATTYLKMCMLTVQNVVALLNGGSPDPKSIFNRKDLE